MTENDDTTPIPAAPASREDAAATTSAPPTIAAELPVAAEAKPEDSTASTPPQSCEASGGAHAAPQQSPTTRSETRSVGRAGKYDCNICFDEAKEPVVTRCGHLYCWPCLYAWLKRGVPECPVCKAGVTKETVTPIFGQGADATDPRSRSEPDESIPHRPRGERPQAPPHQRQNAGGWTSFSAAAFSFGIFPFGGFGFTWSPGQVGQQQRASGGTTAAARPIPRDEQISQSLSLMFLFVGILVTLYILLMGGAGPDF